MSNILIVAGVFPPEPIVSAKIAYDLSVALSKNHQITVLCPKPTRPFGFDFSSSKISDEQFTRIEMNSFTCPQSSFTGRFRENYSFGLQTAKYIDDHHQEIDAVYADTWPLFGQYFVVRAARKHNLPVVIHVQDIYPQSLANKLGPLSAIVNFILLQLDKYILKKATAIIAISEYMKEYLAQTREIEKQKISVVLNWQDESSFLQVNNKQASFDKFTFMYLGNIGPVAGVELLIDAFAEANIPDSRLVVAGSGSQKSELIKKAKLHQRSDIQFWSVPEGKVAESQSKADVMLLPIKKGAASSSIPSKLPAYMFSAKPVICCADADSFTARSIKESGCGYVVEPENSLELSKKLVLIAQQKNEVLNHMGENGCKYARAVFSKNANLNKLVKVVNDLIIS